MQENNNISTFDIAAKLSQINLSSKKKRHISTDSIITVKDFEIYELKSKPSNKTKKIKNIYENQNEFLKNKKIVFSQLPKKYIEDNENEIDCDINEKTQISNNKTNKLIYNIKDNNLYKIAYDKIVKFYFPIYQKISDTNFILNEATIKELLTQINNYIKKDISLFEDINIFQGYFSKLYIYELITVITFIYYFQLNQNLYFSICEEMEPLDIMLLYNLLRNNYKNIYEIVIMLLVLNESKKGEPKLMFEDLCFNFVHQYYEGSFNPTKDTILDKINIIIDDTFQNLLQISNIISSYLSQNVDLNNQQNQYDDQFLDLISYFELIATILKEIQYINNSNNKEYIPEKVNELKEYCNILISIYNTLYNENKVTIPYLPPLDNTKYKYTLVLDLDETLVHYMEENDKAFVQVRPGAENFIKIMSQIYEIIIFTAASKEYADTVLAELNKSKCISYCLYRKHTTIKDGVFLKDLDKLGRDLSKVIIVDNNKENFDLQKSNGLHISTFIGDQSDQELGFLGNDLYELANLNLDDIREGLDNVRNKMNERYINVLKE